MFQHHLIKNVSRRTIIKHATIPNAGIWFLSKMIEVLAFVATERE